MERSGEGKVGNIVYEQNSQIFFINDGVLACANFCESFNDRLLS